MGALLNFYLGLTGFFGNRRRFVRRLAGLCLVVLGVHATADLIDDVVFAAVDAADLGVDNLVMSLLEWLAGGGAIDDIDATRWGRDFATWIDLGEKETLSLWLALIAELAIDLLLLDFAWGTRRPHEAERHVSALEEFRESARELKSALSPIDFERLAIVPVLLAFSGGGTLLAAVAVEGAVADLVGAMAPFWRWSINLAAGLGLLSWALLMWRFVPDLLHGALMRAHERGGEFAKTVATEDASSVSQTLPQWRLQLKKGTRGAALAFILLPLSITALTSQTAMLALIQRTGANL